MPLAWANSGGGASMYMGCAPWIKKFVKKIEKWGLGPLLELFPGYAPVPEIPKGADPEFLKFFSPFSTFFSVPQNRAPPTPIPEYASVLDPS